MEKSTKKKLLIGSALVVVLGVGGYFLWKYLKNKKEEAEKKKAEEEAAAAALAASTSTSTTPASAPKSGAPANYGPFKSSSEVKAFQDWLDLLHPFWLGAGKIGLNKGSGYGTYGPATAKAWAAYGAEYTKKPTQPSSSSSSSTPPPTQPAYDPAKILVGDTVWVKSPIPSQWKTQDNGVSGYTGAGLTTKFFSGGIRYGNFYAGGEAGSVVAIDSTNNSVKVRNSKYPMKSESGSYVTEFWMPMDVLTRLRWATSFDGMTVTYQPSTI